MSDIKELTKAALAKVFTHAYNKMPEFAIGKEPEDRESKIALTAEEKAFAAERGITEEEYLKAKKEASER